jgi:hypothetical protein
VIPRAPGHSSILALCVALACDAAPPSVADRSGDATPQPTPVDPVAPVEVAEATPTVSPPPVADADAPAEPVAAELPLVRPEGFGRVRPPVAPPAPETLTTHGLAGFEVVAIHARPDLASPRLGYLRFGQRVMVTPKIADAGVGCEKGFHALGVGGFACASKGLIVDDAAPPYMYLPPPAPRLDDPIPYDYGVIAQDGTPLWWKMADAEEILLAAQRYEKIAAAAAAAAEAAAAADGPKDAKPKDAKAKDAKAKDTKAKSEPDAGADDDAAAEPDAADEPDATPEPRELPNVDADDDADDEPPVELTPEERAEQRRREAAAKKRAAEKAEQERERERALARKAARLPLNSKSPFLEAGFVITLGEKVKDDGRSWWRTTRGGFVQSGRAWRKPTSDFHGGEIPAGSGSLFGFVMEENASGSMMSARGKLEWKRKLGFRELLVFAERVEIGGRPYLVTADGLHVREADLRLAQPATRPAELRDYERWIDVDLERQLLVAYEGDTPVYATLVSTGKKGTEEESFLTPTGKFRIVTKHVSSSMDGNTASDGAYSIQDVPWAMFFHGNFALHGAFWHSKFGSRRSHGCVNLGPTDARWLFFWTTPLLPEGWHGVSAHDGAPGSMVVIH